MTDAARLDLDSYPSRLGFRNFALHKLKGSLRLRDLHGTHFVRHIFLSSRFSERQGPRSHMKTSYFLMGTPRENSAQNGTWSGSLALGIGASAPISPSNFEPRSCKRRESPTALATLAAGSPRLGRVLPRIIPSTSPRSEIGSGFCP